MKRKYRNSGYSEGGANQRKGTLKSWQPVHLSAISDIEKNLYSLRNRAADLVINSAIGQAAIKTMVAGVVNEGLKVYPRINHEELKMTAEEGRQWARQVKTEFEKWGESCDWTRRNTFLEMQKIAFQSSLTDGDSFCLFKRKTPTAENPYSLRLQLIEAGRVSNPQQGNFSLVEMKYKNSRIINGIEVDREGLQAIWISNKIWNEPLMTEPLAEWKRVKVFGRLGRNVLQICNDSRIDQYRGEPYLSPAIELIKNLARYTDAELTSAILKTYLSFFLVQKASENAYDLNEIFHEYTSEDVADIKIGAGTMTLLPPGLEVEAINPAGASSTYESFTIQLTKQISASLGLPYEVLLKNFQSSYSASKAALLQAENEFRQRRRAFIVDFLQPVYETFLVEAVAIGKIKAPNFFENRYLYSQADWYNHTNNIIDPVKEVSAAKARIELGLSSRQKEAAELYGVDYFENLRQLKEEMQGLGARDQGSEF